MNRTKTITLRISKNLLFCLLVIVVNGCVMGPLVLVDSSGKWQSESVSSGPNAESIKSKGPHKKQRSVIEGLSSSQIQDIIAKEGVTLIHHSKHLSFSTALLSVDESMKIKNLYPQSKVYEDTSIRIDEPMEIKTSLTRSPDSTQQLKPWGVTEVKADRVHNLSRGENITICVVDTGIQKDHPDLKNNVVGGISVIHADEKPFAQESWDDDNGHGTHVAGIIAAEDNDIGVVGVAPMAKIYAVKVLNAQGTGSLSDAADAIMECIDKKTQIINLSFSAAGNPALDSPFKAAIAKAQMEGIYIVGAAGNSGDKIQNYIPTGYPGVKVIAALDVLRKIPEWSNYGLNSDCFSAPGVAIPSTFLNSDYKVLSGTSMAAPHVAGLYALALAHKKNKIKTIDLKVSISRQGAGMVDAEATLNAQD